MNITQHQLWCWMWAGKYPPGFPSFERPELIPLERAATAVTARKIGGIPKGRKVKVVMVSRFGDVGITTYLIVPSGYHERPVCEGEHNNNALKDIKLIEDPRAAEMGVVSFDEMKWDDNPEEADD